ncbi:MAG: hypothetical protein ACOCZV_01620 [Nanoarchaeota archaeon]
MAFALVLVGGLALAALPEGANIESETDEGEFPGISSESIDVTDGHVYNTDLNTTMSTYRWSGIYGNVSGNIVLSDDDSDVLYDWSAQGRLVYASESTPDWSALTDATENNVTAAYPHIGNADSDNYSTTFTGASESVDSGIYTSLSSDYAQTYDNETTATWKTYSLQDASSNIVFAGLVQQGGAASYKGSIVDYQMIVPEDGTEGDDSATTYNLYAELQ